MRKLTFGLLATTAVVFAMLPLAAWAFFLGDDGATNNPSPREVSIVATQQETAADQLAFEFQDTGCPLGGSFIDG